MSKALFLTQENPFPPRGSDKFRDFHVLRLLCEKVDEVELLFLTDEQTPSENETIEINGFEHPKKLTISRIHKESPNFIRKLLRPRTLNVYAEPVERALQERAEPGKLLWISRLLMASCVPLARSLGYRVILDEHNVESALLKQRVGSPLKRIPNFIVAAQAGYYESRFCLKSNAVVAASNIDATRLSKIAPGASVHIMPNTVDHASFESVRASEGTTLFFSGSLSHPTNVQGLQWFVDEIMPRLRAKLSHKLPRVVVAGSNPGHEFARALKTAGVDVVANPESMNPHFADAAVVFVPIRSGGGTPLKILEAMAAGRAVVSTGKATEGLVLAPTYDILIADNADGFTSALLRLLENPQLRREMGAHAAQTVLNRYDWRCSRTVIEELLKTVLPVG